MFQAKAKNQVKEGIYTQECHNERFLSVMSPYLLDPEFTSNLDNLRQNFIDLNIVSLLAQTKFLENNESPSAKVILSLAKICNISIKDLLFNLDLEITVDHLKQKVYSVVLNFTEDQPDVNFVIKTPSPLLKLLSTQSDTASASNNHILPNLEQIYQDPELFITILNSADYIEEEYLLNHIPEAWKNDEVFRQAIIDYHLNRSQNLFFQLIDNKLFNDDYLVEYQNGGQMIVRKDGQGIYFNEKGQVMPPVLLDQANLGDIKQVLTGKNINRFAQVFLITNPNGSNVFRADIKDRDLDGAITTPGKEMALISWGKETIIHLDMRQLDYIKKYASHIITAVKPKS